MIIIKDKSRILNVYFHKLDEYSSQVNNVVNIKLVGIGEEVYDLGEYNIEDEYDNFYVVKLDLSSIPDGEYEWKLYVWHNEQEDAMTYNNMQYNDCGLMRIGCLRTSAIQPNFDKDNVTQFDNKNIYKEFNG